MSFLVSFRLEEDDSSLILGASSRNDVSDGGFFLRCFLSSDFDCSAEPGLAVALVSAAADIVDMVVSRLITGLTSNKSSMPNKESSSLAAAPAASAVVAVVVAVVAIRPFFGGGGFKGRATSGRTPGSPISPTIDRIVSCMRRQKESPRSNSLISFWVVLVFIIMFFHSSSVQSGVLLLLLLLLSVALLLLLLMFEFSLLSVFVVERCRCLLMRCACPIARPNPLREAPPQTCLAT
mmetsp:Transcript_24026/g.37030  ORF Transcript_24026/g.37030 Transcript_24026/m.37030 type:complete len:236 (+) Transcript_24026:1332-2039(+)